MLIYTILFCTRPEQEPLHRWRCQNDVEREWITALLQYNFTASLEWTLINSYRSDAATFNAPWRDDMSMSKVSIPGCLSLHAWAPVQQAVVGAAKDVPFKFHVYRYAKLGAYHQPNPGSRNVPKRCHAN